jgi:lipopolysaccharide/colanic/teichoic acid biosynthesis glycosyltransferase
MKRLFDLVISFFGILFVLPVLLPVIFMVWRQDGHSPLYVAPRIGRNAAPFKMIKLRSMVVNADKSGVDSTGTNDRRITPLGHFIRRYKLDELTQLWNVLKGDMSLVGPRPNVQRETDLYTSLERQLLTVKPGITDFSSIVFSDEGDILKNQPDPDIAYNQLIRPGKSLLGLFYIEHQSLLLDIWLCWLTVVAILSRQKALSKIHLLLQRLGADAALLELASRQKTLTPRPPPGGNKVVTSRDGNPFV